MWGRYVSSGGGAALTPATPPSETLDLENALLVMVGASNVEGNAGATPATYMLDKSPFDTNGASVSNQGHGGNSFSGQIDANHLLQQTAAVQALRGTASGPEILLIFGDPAVNEFISGGGSRTPAQVQTSWRALVDFYRANGWAPADGRRIVIVNCLDADEGDWSGSGDVESWNTLIASDWQSRADLLIDVHSIVPALVDGIHMTATNADDMAELLATGLQLLE